MQKESLVRVQDKLVTLNAVVDADSKVNSHLDACRLCSLYLLTLP